MLHLSQVIGAALTARDGERIGRVADLIVRLEEGGYPPITGLRATIAGRDVFVPAERLADLAPGRVQLSGEQVDLGRFERRPDEVLLGKDVLDRQLINVEGARLVRASEIELARVEFIWRLARNRELLGGHANGRRFDVLAAATVVWTSALSLVLLAVTLF